MTTSQHAQPRVPARDFPETATAGALDQIPRR